MPWGEVSVVEPNKEHHPDLLQHVGSLQEQGVRAQPAPRPLAQAGDGGAAHGLQNTSAAPFTSLLAGSGPSVSGSTLVSQLSAGSLQQPMVGTGSAGESKELSSLEKGSARDAVPWERHAGAEDGGGRLEMGAEPSIGARIGFGLPCKLQE